MTTMRAAVVTEFGKDLQIQDLPVPVPGRGEALVKVLTTGVCHTDLHAAEGDWPVKPSPPFIPGHEGVGEVVQRDAPADAQRVGAGGDSTRERVDDSGWKSLEEMHQHPRRPPGKDSRLDERGPLHHAAC